MKYMKVRLMSERRTDMLRTASEIETIRALLDEAYSNFNILTDSDLLEACIYEINALHARYDYAIKAAKVQAFQAEVKRGVER